MRSLLFLTEGGGGVGLGHIRRCLTLATALTKFGLASEFRVAGGDAAESIVARAGFGVAPIASTSSVAEVARAVQASSATGVVIDSYAATEEVFRATGMATIVMDDLADRRLPVDIVINPAISALRLGYDRLTDAHLLLGPQYALLRPEFATAARTVRSVISRILITLGGGDHGSLVSDVARWCATVAPEATIEVVIGPFSDRSRIDETERVIILNQPDIPEAMIRADLAVASGGQTLFELAATGLPAITVATAGNQAQNLADFAAAGTIRSAGRRIDAHLEAQFVAAFDELRSADVRREMSARGPCLVDGRGAERVASSMVTLLRESRSAIG